MSSKQYLKEFRNKQQVKDNQINCLLADVEKNLEEYRNALELKEKQLFEVRRILISAKQSYDNKLAENKNLKAYISSLKAHIEKQQIQLLKIEKNKRFRKLIPKKYKKGVFEEEESESETELEQGQQEESESKEIEEQKAPSKKRTVNRNNIFDYINQKDAKRHKQ